MSDILFISKYMFVFNVSVHLSVISSARPYLTCVIHMWYGLACETNLGWTKLRMNLSAPVETWPVVGASVLKQCNYIFVYFAICYACILAVWDFMFERGDWKWQKIIFGLLSIIIAISMHYIGNIVLIPEKINMVNKKKGGGLIIDIYIWVLQI